MILDLILNYFGISSFIMLSYIFIFNKSYLNIMIIALIMDLFYFKYFVIYFRKNNYNFNRYCISVSKKIGKANVRNLYKRRIKDILMKNNINFCKDYVIILRVNILNLNYEQIQNELINVLKEK